MAETPAFTLPELEGEPRSIDLCIASGSTDIEFAAKVAGLLGKELTPVERRKFSNGELFNRYEESVRGKDVFIINSHHYYSTYYRDDWTTSDSIQEHIFMGDASVGASADHTTAVCPLFGYARQDKKDDGRVAIAARTVARQLTGAGYERLITMDLHSPQIQGFTDNHIPFENLFGSSVILEGIMDWAADKEPGEIVILSPDESSIKRAKYIRNALVKLLDIRGGDGEIEIAIIDKERAADSTRVRSANIIGDVVGRHVLSVDDMIDTAKTLASTASTIKAKGAKSMSAAATHAILSGPALSVIRDSDLEKIIVTDTVPLQPAKDELGDRIDERTVTGIFADVIWRIHHNDSVSTVFDNQRVFG